MAELAMSADR